MYIDVLNYGCGSVSRAFGVLVSGCIHTHVNCKVEYIRRIFVCMLIYLIVVEGIVILRRSSINGCVVWLVKFFHVKVVDLLWR